MSALTDYSKWDAIDDSSDAESDAAQQNAPKEDPVLTGAKNVVCQLRAKLSLLPEGTLDEGWTSPPLPGGWQCPVQIDFAVLHPSSSGLTLR